MLTFIVNSALRGDRGTAVMAQVSEILQSRGVEFESFRTEAAGHATALAQEAVRRGSTIVVAVGGDGTVREVAEGLVAAGSDGAMGILPCGTGNDYRRTLDIPDDTAAALEIILGGHRRSVDAARLNGVLYCNIASVGLDVAVVEAARRIRMGPLSYYAGVFSTLVGYKSRQMEITIDGQHQSRKMLLCAVGVGTRYGGGMKVLPDALPDDGELDYCLVDPLTRRKILILFPQFPSGGHKRFPFVHLGRCKTLTITSDEPFSAQADGEVIQGLTSATFETLPNALTVLTAEIAI